MACARAPAWIRRRSSRAARGRCGRARWPPASAPGWGSGELWIRPRAHCDARRHRRVCSGRGALRGRLPLRAAFGLRRRRLLLVLVAALVLGAVRRGLLLLVLVLGL